MTTPAYAQDTFPLSAVYHKGITLLGPKIIKRIPAQFLIQIYYYKKSIVLLMVSLNNVNCNFFLGIVTTPEE